MASDGGIGIREPVHTSAPPPALIAPEIQLKQVRLGLGLCTVRIVRATRFASLRCLGRFASIDRGP